MTFTERRQGQHLEVFTWVEAHLIYVDIHIMAIIVAGKCQCELCSPSPLTSEHGPVSSSLG